MPGTPHRCAAFRAAMDILGRPWNGAILRELQAGPARFSELGERLAIGDRMLSVRLKELEAADLLTRHVDPGPPVRVSYAATALGAGIGPIQGAIEDWGELLLAAHVEPVAGLCGAEGACPGEAPER